MHRTLQRLVVFSCSLTFLVAGVSEAMGSDIAAPAQVNARPIRMLAPERALLVESFDRADGLITNSYATWNPHDARRRSDPVWQMTSGSLFSSSGEGWTGRPDGGAPNVDSTAATGSSVFRLTTLRSDFRDVRLSMRLRVDSLGSTARTQPVAWDGVHLWVRHVDQYHLYAASVLRRDGTITLKKKCPGGTENGGTYFTLGDRSTGHDFVPGAWQDVAVEAEDVSGGVRLTVEVAGEVIVRVVDRGIGCAPIMQSGAIGIRSDNAEARFDDITVLQL